MNVLVTGGGGFIGRAIINGLLDKNYQVSSISRNPYPNLKSIGVETIRGDIRDRDKMLQACKGIDAVFHVAAKVGLWGKYKDFYKTNVDGTKNVIRACLAHQVKYLIFTSSASVVFDGTNIEGGNESLPYPLKPVSNYTATKALAEKLILAANGQSLKTISLRPHLVWGPGDKHIMPGILQRARSGKLRQIGNNNNLVDTTYIDNLTDAHLLALKALTENRGADGKAYFITNGEPVRIWDFINAIITTYDLQPIEKKLSKKTALYVAGAMEIFNKIFKPGKEPLLTRFAVNELCTSHWFNLSNALRDISYKPRISIKTGLEILKKCVEENKV